MNLELLYPKYLLLILLYLLLDYIFSKSQKVEFSNLKLLKQAAIKSFDFSKIIRLLIVIALLVALATPVVKKKSISKSRTGYDISLLLDASYSMQEENRFKIAKKIIAKFIKDRKNDNIALTIFGNYAYVLSPLTYDKKGLLDTLKYLKLGTIGGRNTALYEALFLGADSFKNSSRTNRVLILLTDGINTVDSISLDSALAKLKKANVKVYTIALGKSGDYNKKLLEKIAKNSGGKFFEALKPTELDLIYSKIDSLEKGKIKSKITIEYKYYYKIPLIFALILILLYIFKYSSGKRVFLIASAFAIIYTLLWVKSDNFNSSSQKDSIAIALDLSYYMDAKDIYPNRLKFAKAKAKELISKLNGQKVALLGFAEKAYLISLPTNDYERLLYLIDNLDANVIERNSVDFAKLINSVKKLLKDTKSLIIFSSGGSGSLKEAINLANSSNLDIYIYATATKKGDIIKIDNKILKDRFGNIVVSSINTNLKNLATKAYLEYNDNLDAFLSKLPKSAAAKYKSKTKHIVPILIAFILFLFAVFRRGK